MSRIGHTRPRPHPACGQGSANRPPALQRDGEIVAVEAHALMEIAGVPSSERAAVQ